MNAQRRVAEFIVRHDLSTAPEYRALDLVSEVGEIAKEINESTGYGATGEVEIAADEVGDALFALLALADGVGVDADGALDTAMRKYEARLEETGDAASG